MAPRWKYGALSLLAGFVLAIHASHDLLPSRQPIVPVSVTDWLTTRIPSRRGHFRQTLRISFQPDHAWLAIAADDYQLFINGVKVASNMHMINAGNAFQDRLSDSAQRLSYGAAFNMVRDPLLKQRANEEWRCLQFYDIRHYLTVGRNTIAVYVQSDKVNCLAVRGAVSGGSQEMAILGEAPAWRASTEPGVLGGVQWNDPSYDDLGWEEAQTAQAPADKPLFASLDPAIWTEPFRAEAVTAPVNADQVLFQTKLSSAWAGQTGWLRVRGNWHYDVFVGPALAGGGEGPAHVTVLDVTPYLQDAPGQLTIRLHKTYHDELEPPQSSKSSNSTREVPWVAVEGRIGGDSVSTSAGWNYLTRFDPDWLSGGGVWQPAPSHAVTWPPLDVSVKPPPYPDRRWLGVFFLTVLLAASILAAVTWIMSRWLPQAFRQQGCPLSFTWWLLAPALFGIFLQELLRFRFSECDTVLFFLDPSHAWLLMLTGPVLLVLSLGLILRPGWSGNTRRGFVDRVLAQIPTWAWLLLFCLLGLALRVYHIDAQPPQADENVSWDAARGILHTGGPLAVSGVLYTRSPLYHYLLAGWLALFGDNLISGRSFSLLPGIAVILAIYYLVHSLTRRPYLGLAAALILALDPWLLGTVNFIRFYQQMQLFAVLTFLFFVKGFICKEGKRYQNLFFLCATAGILSQEIFVTFLPAFFLGFLLCYRPFRWGADKNVWLGFLTMMVIALLDVYSWAVLCLTPHVAVATTSASQILMHFTNGAKSILPGFASIFFWNSNGANIFFSAWFFAGAVYWLRHPRRGVLLLYGTVVLTLGALTVLVVPMAGRYCFALYPLFVSGAVISADALIRSWSRQVSVPALAATLTLRRRWLGLMAALVSLAWVSNAEFDKVLDSYDSTRFIEHHQAAQYVQEHRREGDKVMTVHPQAAAILCGKVDYFIQGVVHFDELYMTRQGIVDRWGGGRLVWKLDQFQEIFRNNDRVWIIVDSMRLVSMAPDIGEYLLRCCSVEAEFFGAQVLLWDKTAGRSFPFPDRGGGVDSF